MTESSGTSGQEITVSPTQIQYILITNVSAYSFSDYFKAAFALLRTLPKDLLQLEDAAYFFDFCYRTGRRSGIDLYILESTMFKGDRDENYAFFTGYSNMFNKDVVRVFMVEGSIGNHREISELINGMPFSYYIMIGDPGPENAAFYDGDKFFAGAGELIGLFDKDLTGINGILKEEYGIYIDRFDLLSNPKADELNPYLPTVYSHTNYFILNQILANYWLKKPMVTKKEDITPFSTERLDIQMRQADIIDGLSQVIKIKPSVTPIEPEFSPMIIVAPYYFPKYGKIQPNIFSGKKQKMFFRASQSEQSLDYNYLIEEDVAEYLTKRQIGMSLAVSANKLLFLDYMAYLHAQFSGSPVIRLPIIGKTMNMDLSHLGNNFSNKQGVVDKIRDIGELMREKLIAERLKEKLLERNGQLIFISDLPMEWLRLGDYPLCLTHDICRVPEFNFNSLLNIYIHNQRITFRIRPDVLKNTLIIHCASEGDADMLTIFKKVGELQNSLGFVSVICRTVEEISDAIKRYQPELLIFDCHGNFDAKSLSSYLVIDGKNDIRLTGEDIISNGICAPLVFISACSTQPNYGYVKFLSDAFLQAGAFSVTATFLPINMMDAAAFFLRLLTNLKQQEDKIIFSNWLAFISHTLRSVAIFEAVRKVRKRYRITNEIDDNKIAQILLELMVFQGREKAFKKLESYLQTINPDIKLSFGNLDHEWLSYTTLGRADLVYFDEWYLKHQEINA